MAYAGGSYASSFLNNNTNHISPKNIQEETINERAELNIADYPENENYIGGTEDFSIIEKKELPSEESIKLENSLSFNKEEHQFVSSNSENHIQNNKDISIENNPQTTTETNHSQNISQNHNENFVEKTQSESLEHKTAVLEQRPQMFNEAVHKEDWIEEGENLNRPPQKEKNNEGDIEL